MGGAIVLRYMRLFRGYGVQRLMLFACRHGESLKNWFEDISLSASGHGTIKAAIALRDEDGRCDLKAVHVPTAIYQGNCDVVVDNELTMYQYKHIPGAILYELPESGHGVIYDQLELFNGYFMDFICNRK